MYGTSLPSRLIHLMCCRTMNPWVIEDHASKLEPYDDDIRRMYGQ